ncbi:hypothetical protein [Streptomyces sp. NPDC001604]|uniref:hypothetical protein n=1 Tax=Streptomyces sp. NPDC001604 TaxID=3364593 RepID=UPI0036D1046B
MEEAERLCDRVGIIDRGRLIAEGSPRELVELVAERDRVRLTAVGGLSAYAEACRRLARVEGVARGGDRGDVVATSWTVCCASRACRAPGRSSTTTVTARPPASWMVLLGSPAGASTDRRRS